MNTNADGASGGYDWRQDTPWQRLPWTLPGALLIFLLALWITSGLMQGSRPGTQPISPIDARLIEIPLPEPERPPVEKNRRSPPHAEKPRSKPVSQPVKTPASLAAPQAPSAEEWQLASTYTLKNSKRYRHNWGQQVRSMMGTAVEGPDQGQVRLRVEIAPDGKVAKVEELWSTSPLASRLARQAIKNLPPLPPTPTGKPLIFEQTLSFLPHETGWPPSYKLDCLPDPPAFRNRFAWDGGASQATVKEVPADADGKANDSPPAECITDSTASSIEEEEGELKRQMEKNRWGR